MSFHLEPSASFTQVEAHLFNLLHSYGRRVKPLYWQGMSTTRKPEMATVELTNVSFSVPLITDDLHHWRQDIRPFLPWADDHFDERVGRQPANPGNTWHNWRHGASADRFRNIHGEFNHTYMERLWPRYANGAENPRQGIRWEYGDLDSIVQLLVKDPLTRQAYLPLFFPEDTGIGDGGRKPCTLGYQFLMRDDRLDIWYPLRSCDFAHHFLDDCYLAVRLLLWVLQECQRHDSDWNRVKPGTYSMHATSLHIFINDYITRVRACG